MSKLQRLRYQPEKTSLDIRPQAQKTGAKPSGLWYSVGDEWKQWCKAEDFRVSKLNVVYEIAVNKDAILFLTSEQQIREFSVEFMLRSTPWQTWDIDWSRVAEQWAGIEIAPYQYGCRFDSDSRWYSGWDVASGCIWGPEALLGWKEIS